MAIFDLHAHLRPDQTSLATLLSAMDECGIAKTIVVGGGLIPVPDLSKRLGGETDLPFSDAVFDNESLRDLCKRTNGRVIPFFFAHPKKDHDLYQRTGAAFGGLKLAPVVHGAPFASDAIFALLEEARALNHPVYTHCLGRPGLSARDLVQAARAFPQIRFILGHAGTHVLDLDSIDVIASEDNIYYETSGGYRFTIEVALAKLGADRIVFGTEFPLQDPFIELAKIKRLRCDETSRAKILSGNARRLVEGL